MQKSLFPQKIQKSLCITTKSLYTNSKFQTQLSRKLQRFRGCHKNKKCPIFHDLSEYIIFHMMVSEWPDPNECIYDVQNCIYFIFKNGRPLKKFSKDDNSIEMSKNSY